MIADKPVFWHSGEEQVDARGWWIVMLYDVDIAVVVIDGYDELAVCCTVVSYTDPSYNGFGCTGLVYTDSNYTGLNYTA